MPVCLKNASAISISTEALYVIGGQLEQQKDKFMDAKKQIV
jgi:hypothetical protein